MTSYQQPFEQDPLQHHVPPGTSNLFSVGKRSRATARQLEEMVELMLQNRDLAVGRFSGPMGQEKNERTWEEIAAKISPFGSTKTGVQCKTSWRDLKLKVKAKNASIRKSRLATGNASKVPELTELDKKILLIIGTESSEGVGVEESGLEGQQIVTVPPAPAAAAGAAAAAHSSIYVKQNEYEVDIVTEPTHFVEETESVPPPSTPLQQPHATLPHQTAANVQQPSAGSRKRPVEVDDVAKQYAELQANTNAILADIAQILRQAVNDKEETDRERNNLIKERNEIEREKLGLEKKKLKIKSLQLKMMMQNQHDESE